MRKTSISQRWSSKFLDTTRDYAGKADCSITQFTIDGITLLGKLIEFQEILDISNEERVIYISKALNSYRSTYLKEHNRKTIPNNSKKKYDRVEEYLISNPQKIYSTNDLAILLDINQSTVRTYVNKLGDKKGFNLYLGRPNRIEFVGEN